MVTLSGIVKSLVQYSTVETIMQFGSSLEKKNYNDIDLCIFTRKKLSLTEKLNLLRDIPQKFDVCFYDDLPLHIKHEVLTKGKILYTKNYYQLLKYVQYVDLEYPRYKLFLEEYHQEMVAAL